MLSDFDPANYLDKLGVMPDEEIDLAKSAVALAAPQYQGRSLGRYIHHFTSLAADVAVRHSDLLEAGSADDVETRLAALKHILADKAGYDGDRQDSNNILNSDMIAVIDRAKGSPVTLSLLYIAVARAQGWQIEALDIPGHFLARLAKDGRLLIFDPFNNAQPVQAPEIRAFVKSALGSTAELSANYFEPLSNRSILIRLLNTIKSRQIEDSDYDAALQTIQLMRKVDPQEYRLLLDEGVLLSKTGKPREALFSLEDYVDKVENPKDRDDALRLLSHIRMTLDE